METRRLMIGETISIPQHVVKCPECGECLLVTSYGSDVESGKPLCDTLQVDCENEDLDDEECGIGHNFRQSDWQPVLDKVREMVGAV